MQIKLNTMIGNVDQINILNHYIGMKHIIPKEIPELKIVPFLFFGLILLGFVVLFLNRPGLGYIWSILLVLGALLGIADLYRWGYDYGHNLNPEAPIKIPGMSYQPPLIGHKTLLNIDSYSVPDIGGYLIGIATILAFVALFWNHLSPIFLNRRLASMDQTKKRSPLLMLLFLCVSLVSCQYKTEAIRVGEDHCDYCRMVITDTRFGGEVLTPKGRTLKFDALSCLVNYLKENPVNSEHIFVLDYLKPGTLVPVTQAYFLRSQGLKAPMGEAIIASSDESGLRKLQKTTKGDWLDWKNISPSQ